MYVTFLSILAGCVVELFFFPRVVDIAALGKEREKRGNLRSRTFKIERGSRDVEMVDEPEVGTETEILELISHQFHWSLVVFEPG